MKPIDPQKKPWIMLALLAVGVVVVAAVVVRAFLAPPNTVGRGQGISSPPEVTTPPAFSIPKVQGCNAAAAADVAAIEATLRPGLTLTHSYAEKSGAITYVAGRLTTSGTAARDDPGLWAAHGADIFAVGATTSVSSASSANAIAVFGNSPAAAHVISCAAGY
jgi:hypothetical protein